MTRRTLECVENSEIRFLILKSITVEDVRKCGNNDKRNKMVGERMLLSASVWWRQNWTTALVLLCA